MELGLSKEGIEYALRYLITHEDVATGEIKRSKNVSGIHEEFYNVFHTNNFTSLLEFFKYIALDAVSESEDEREIGFKCTGCVQSERLEKVIIDKTVCYLLKLEEVDARIPLSKGYPVYEIRVPDRSDGIIDQRAYWKLYIGPMVNQFTPRVPYLSIFDQRSHRVSFYSIIHRLHTHEPCIEPDDPKYPNYSSPGCALGCVGVYYRILHGCSVLNLDTNLTRPLKEFCNTYYWERWPVRKHIHQGRMKAFMYACIDRCREECSFPYISTEMDSHLSNDLVREAAEWNKGNKTGVRYRYYLFLFNLFVLCHQY